jgi:hypothetical protein
MSDQAELHGKILGFLMGEWARKDNRQLVSVDLLYAPGSGYRDEEIRKWVRADEPDLFAEFVNIEKLVAQIVEIATGEADAKAPGKHRFIVRCTQHGGSRPTHSFALSPSYTGNDDVAIMPTGGGGGGGGVSSKDQQVIANHAGQLMRINAQMFEGTIRVLGQQNMALHQQVSDLTADNANLRRDLEEARSNRMDREFQIAMATEKNMRTNAGFQKLLQIGTVVAAKIGGGDDNSGNQHPSTSPLGMLLGEFYQSLRPDQMGAMMQMLDMAQKMLFMEIVNLIKPPEQTGGPGGPGGPGPNGKSAGPPPGPPAGPPRGAPAVR